jgi:hypothetical protein
MNSLPSEAADKRRDAKVGGETEHQPKIGKHSLHESKMKMASDWSTLPQAG